MIYIVSDCRYFFHVRGKNTKLVCKFSSKPTIKVTDVERNQYRRRSGIFIATLNICWVAAMFSTTKTKQDLILVLKTS